MTTRAILYDAEGRDREIALDASAVSAVGQQRLLWVDIETDGNDDSRHVGNVLQIPPALWQAIADVLPARDPAAPRRPRLDHYGPCFYVGVEAIHSQHGTDVAAEARRISRGFLPAAVAGAPLRPIYVHFVVFPNIVVTLHSEPVDFLESFERRIKGETSFGAQDGPALLGALLSWHVTSYFRILETLEAEVDAIDDAALRLPRRSGGDDRSLLSSMVRARRRIALVRRTLLPHREVYAGLARPQFAPFVTAEATDYLALVYERLERAVEATENARELVLNSFEVFSTQTALRTNEIVKVLTVMSVLLLPAGVVTNLAPLLVHSPAYDLGREGFWLILAASALVAIGGVMMARARRWL